MDSSCRPYSAKPERLWKRRDKFRRPEKARRSPFAFQEARHWVLPDTSVSEPFPRTATRRSNRERFAAVEEAIDASRKLLALPERWDDEEARRILPSTWDKAVGLLRRTTSAVYRRSEAVLKAPRISPCSDGSIDIFWKTNAFKLLVNIRPDGQGDSDFYGESKDGLMVKGTFRPDGHDLGFVDWLR